MRIAANLFGITRPTAAEVLEAQAAFRRGPERHQRLDSGSAKVARGLALAKEQVETIWKAAGKLSERQRTVFLLRFVEDMDLLEIAAVTGMKEGTVKTHLFRAVQSLRLGLEHGK
jgi:RNA polymerase sigma factor (sigma-70 family)